tara:strand:- start:169 stop:1401 length:1233 start_codon:yes stop_codon:yes gene_type:complete
MAKQEEKPVVDNETGKIKVKAKKEQQPTSNETKGNVTKVKAKMKKQSEVLGETITKVNIDEPAKLEENETKENNVDNEGVVTELKNTDASQEQEKIQPQVETQETPVVEEVTQEQVEELETKVTEAIVESVETGKDLPENIQKLLEFMEDTGGDLEDYVRLNQDYSELDNNAVLKEYYKQTKPHLNNEEIEFLMEDTFSYDEDVDEEVEIKRKKLALKEQVAQAKAHLDSAKSKYYEDIKYGSKLTSEQQKAIDFFNRYNKESEEQQKATKQSQSVFTQKTNEVFNSNFKGFEYNIGDKRFRFNVNDVDTVKRNQSDITNFTKKFLDENSTLKDAKGYHKSMFTAMNADAIAAHFYEQGKTDALKDSIARSKNINMDPRQQHSGVVEAGGIKVRVLGENSNDFKFKIKNK